LKHPNHYEFLQISPNAEPEIIHGVYRILAPRFGPDNLETGDAGKFLRLQQAYEVLSTPERRAKYDEACQAEVSEPDQSSDWIQFMDNFDSEVNRRLAVMAMLYVRRRTDPGAPEASLKEVTTHLGISREHLEFTIWYLQKKGYINRADNSEFTLTVEGVDFVERQRRSVPARNRMPNDGAGLYAINGPGTERDLKFLPMSENETKDRRLGADRRKQA
jgi:curved DNA-binding protein CbpA